MQAFAFTLYITIHRWRHDVKTGLTDEDLDFIGIKIPMHRRLLKEKTRSWLL